MAAKPPPPPEGSTEERPKSPKLTVVNPEKQATGDAPRVLMAPSADGTRKGYAATESPIVTSLAGTPGVTRWRVSRDIGGERVFLGNLATHAQPEALIENFPGGMPLPGQVGLYFLRGVNTENKETGHEYAFRISGDSPEVQAARKSLVGGPAVAAPVGPGPEVYAAELRRQTEALALERRQLADQRVADEKSRADVIKAESEARIAEIREQGRLALEAEKARREQDRADMEARLSADRAERERQAAATLADRERRDKLDREETTRREAALEQQRKDEREREREHRETMAKLNAKSSLEGIATTVTAITAALGINPKDIVGKVFGGDGDSSKDTATAIAETVGTAITEFGTTARTWMEIQAGKTPGGGNGAERTQEPRRERKRIEERGGDAGATGDAGGAKEEPAKGPSRNEALDAIPVSALKKARNAMRELIEELKPLSQDQYAPKALAAVARVPVLLQYLKAVGVKAACVEAGMSAEDAAKVAAAVPAGALA